MSDAQKERRLHVHSPKRGCACDGCVRIRLEAKERGRARLYVLESKYGITPDEFLAMRDAQGGVCAICSKPETARRGDRVVRLSVDHDHSKTGKESVRGLLCRQCNARLHALENIEWRTRAEAYLARFSKESAAV